MSNGPRALLPGLLTATLLAAALRLAALDRVPVSLYCDEAFSGYEAYCLLQTGRDSRGVAMPLFFDIFGKGWAEPLYIYLTVPAVAAFGLTPFSARFAAAIAGALAAGFTGLMCAALLRELPQERLAARAGVAAAFLMAISPWSFHLSRVAFQSSLLPAALAAGFWLAAAALRGTGEAQRGVKPGVLVAAAVVLGLSLYTYTVARLAMPLLLAGFIWLHRRRLAAAQRASQVAGLVLALLALPIAGFSMTAQGRQRFSDVTILGRSDVASGGASAAVPAIAANYLSYYSPRFLLAEGDPNLRHSIRGHGILHPHDAILLALGAAACTVARTPGASFLLWWLLSFPAAASLTIDPRHAVRAICGQPGVYALAGLGGGLLWALAAATAASRWRRLAAAGLLVLMLLAAGAPAALYFRDYFSAYPVYSGAAWQYGLQEVYDYVESVAAGHDSIYITRYEDFPHALLLFHRVFPPEEYQVHRLSRTRYLFDQDRWVRGPGRLNPIFVWKPQEIPEGGIQVRKVIKYPDGGDAFVIAW